MDNGLLIISHDASCRLFHLLQYFICELCFFYSFKSLVAVSLDVTNTKKSLQETLTWRPQNTFLRRVCDKINICHLVPLFMYTFHRSEFFNSVFIRILTLLKVCN